MPTTIQMWEEISHLCRNGHVRKRTGEASQTKKEIIQGAQPGDANYYPLKVGHEWTYKMPGDTEDNEQTIRVAEYSDEYRAYLVRTIFRIGGALPIGNREIRRGVFLS